LSNDEACWRRIDAGLESAKAKKAELSEIFPAGGVGAHYYDESIIPQDTRKVLRGRKDEFRDSIRKLFLERAEAAGLKAQWRAPRGDADEALALHARYCDLLVMSKAEDRKSTRLNSSHVKISYAVFCLKKKK